MGEAAWNPPETGFRAHSCSKLEPNRKKEAPDRWAPSPPQLMQSRAACRRVAVHPDFGGAKPRFTGVGGSVFGVNMLVDGTSFPTGVIVSPLTHI